MNFECVGDGSTVAHVAVNALRHPNDREEVFMPIEKSKPSQNPKSEKDKRIATSSDELSEDDLRSVSGGLSNLGGTQIVDDTGCITKAP